MTHENEDINYQLCEAYNRFRKENLAILLGVSLEHLKACDTPEAALEPKEVVKE